jgi:uncharacterized membrane protein required for colicin V production|tara:strand:- start:529 stop:837 length:309 start_codon:yes stop_codon:yes gene_type:complete
MADDQKKPWRLWSWPSGGKPAPLLGLFVLTAPLALFCAFQLYKAATTGMIYIRYLGDKSFADSPAIFVTQIILLMLCGLVLSYFAMMSLKTLIEGLLKSNQD